MMQEASSKGVFKGCLVGEAGIEVSHLQFAYDSLFLGESSMQNCLNLMALLDNFGKASGLQLNLLKTRLFGIGVSAAEITRMAFRIHCASDTIPFLYLGLPVGDNMKQVASWKKVVEKVNRQLSLWKQRTLSIGGRMTLIKYIFNSLPLYSFSIFRATETTLKNLESLLTKFFWGSTGYSRKLIWAKASRLHGAFSERGLNVRSLKNKNLALLCKWIWRFRIEEDALWVQIVKAIHGEDGGLLSQRVSNPRGPCAAILKASQEVLVEAERLASGETRG